MPKASYAPRTPEDRLAFDSALRALGIEVTAEEALEDRTDDYVVARRIAFVLLYRYYGSSRRAARAVGADTSTVSRHLQRHRDLDDVFSPAFDIPYSLAYGRAYAAFCVGLPRHLFDAWNRSEYLSPASPPAPTPSESSTTTTTDGSATAGPSSFGKPSALPEVAVGGDSLPGPAAPSTSRGATGPTRST